MYPDTNSPGYGSFVKNVVDGLAQNGFYCKYSALIIGRPTTLFIKCIKYIKFYFSILINYFKKYDFLYIHYPNQALPCLIPCYFIKKQKVIVNLHGEDLLYSKKGIPNILGKLNDFFLKKVDAIVVPSNYYRDLVYQRINDKSKLVIVSPSGGINEERFFPKVYMENLNPFIHLGYVGRIDPNKGWQEFLDSIKLLPSTFPFKATIIGYGSDVAKLMDFINNNPSMPIEYISKVEQSELKKYYSEFDILLFPSMRNEESLGLVGLEAMACGTPVIGSNIGGIPSYLIHGYNGFLVEPGDVNQIKKYILEYSLLDSNKRKVLYQNCIESSKKYFSKRVISDLALSFKAII